MLSVCPMVKGRLVPAPTRKRPNAQPFLSSLILPAEMKLFPKGGAAAEARVTPQLSGRRRWLVWPAFRPTASLPLPSQEGLGEAGEGARGARALSLLNLGLIPDHCSVPASTETKHKFWSVLCRLTGNSLAGALLLSAGRGLRRRVHSQADRTPGDLGHWRHGTGVRPSTRLTRQRGPPGTPEHRPCPLRKPSSLGVLSPSVPHGVQLH